MQVILWLGRLENQLREARVMTEVRDRKAEGRERAERQSASERGGRRGMKMAYGRDLHSLRASR